MKAIQYSSYVGFQLCRCLFARDRRRDLFVLRSDGHAGRRYKKLLALDYCLETCAQEAWALWPKLLKECLALPDNEIVVCGMAIGHADRAAPINNFTSERAPFDEYVTVLEQLDKTS